jgi:hypothetical protein
MDAERVMEVIEWDIEWEDGVRESWLGDHMLLAVLLASRYCIMVGNEAVD